MSDGCVNFVDPCWGSGAVWLACPGWGEPMTIPVPWFGGKSRAAALIWDRFGHDLPKVATGNDINGFVANFFRCLATSEARAEAVASFADYPVHEVDLHSIHKWLLRGAADLRAQLDADPDYCDPKVAGRWAWGASCWIGSGWAEGGETPSEQLPVLNGGGGVGASSQKGVLNASLRSPSVRLPDLAGGTQWGTDEPNTRAGKGVHGVALLSPSEQLPYLGGSTGSAGETYVNFGRGVNNAGMREPSRNLPSIGSMQNEKGTGGDGSRGVHVRSARTRLYDLFAELHRRMRYVRFSCGDAFRILTPSVTYRHGLTAIFLDAPYEGFEHVYGVGDATVKPPSDKARSKMSREEQAMWEELTPLYRIGSDGAIDAAPSLSRRFQAYARTHGGRKDLRIIVAGYEGEHDALEREGWEVVEWKAKGGYSNQREGGDNGNKHRERLWCSPHCLRPGRTTGQIVIPGVA